jgi:hypothetical protein
MNRSGYSDYAEDASGQKLLRDLLAALDAMPVKELIAGKLEHKGAVCALGALGMARGLDMSGIRSMNTYDMAEAFDAARALVADIFFTNDGRFAYLTPHDRFLCMREWVAQQIKDAPA